MGEEVKLYAVQPQWKGGPAYATHIKMTESVAQHGKLPGPEQVEKNCPKTLIGKSTNT